MDTPQRPEHEYQRNQSAPIEGDAQIDLEHASPPAAAAGDFEQQLAAAVEEAEICALVLWAAAPFFDLGDVDQGEH